MFFITFRYRYRKQILIGIVIFFIVIVLSSIMVISIMNNREEDDELIIETKENKNKTKVKDEYYKVDIKGQIVNPGIYEMKINSRVIDVIDSAGGLTEDADTSVINLSKKITDEMVIIIYSKSQVEEFEKTKEIEAQVINKCAENEEYSITNDACITVSSNSISNGKININTASIDELMTLQGIGESRAKDIIKYREDHGKFSSIEDLKNVSGIGDNTFANIKENITV